MKTVTIFVLCVSISVAKYHVKDFVETIDVNNIDGGQVSGLNGTLAPEIGFGTLAPEIGFEVTTVKPATTLIPRVNQTCEKSCSEIEKCLETTQKYCDDYCFQFLPPDVQECSKTFEKAKYWTEAREAADTCASYYGVGFKCHNTTEAKLQRGRRFGNPGPPPGKPNHGPGGFGPPPGGPGGPPPGGPGGPPQGPGGPGGHPPPPPGFQPPPNGKRLEKPSDACHNACIKQQEQTNGCFKGCPQPDANQIKYIKQCDQESYGPVEKEFDKCVDDHSDFNQKGQKPSINKRPPPPERVPPGARPPPENLDYGFGPDGKFRGPDGDQYHGPPGGHPRPYGGPRDGPPPNGGPGGGRGRAPPGGGFQPGFDGPRGW